MSPKQEHFLKGYPRKKPILTKNVIIRLHNAIGEHIFISQEVKQIEVCIINNYSV